ncbi:MAG: DUF5658 family protein [Chloroherpetonaceae bacterium]|nr:DUF5658 family protein [Chthonomonadaceae bacterium]MDW8207985.1 DUF5658 family protein [Chloroherpetonaceae bacterium]
MKLMRETCVLVTICLLDLLITLWLIARGHAVEANPLMQAALGMGITWFVGVKLLYTLGPLTALEIVGRRHTLLVRRYLRLGIGLYLGIHIASLGAALIAFCITQARA